MKKFTLPTRWLSLTSLASMLLLTAACENDELKIYPLDTAIIYQGSTNVVTGNEISLRVAPNPGIELTWKFLTKPNGSLATFINSDQSNTSFVADVCSHSINGS